MKHLKDARQLLNEGDAQGALQIIDNILSFSSKNPEALLLKSSILDSWGRFDESLVILHNLAKNSSDQEILLQLNQRIEEDKDTLIYSKLTMEGREYYPFSGKQIVISLFGLIGCILFLVVTPNYYKQPNAGLLIFISFFFLVLIPWFMLIKINFKNVKKIIVGLKGIQVFYGYKSKILNWDLISCAVIEYDKNLNEDYLRLILYSKETRKPLLNVDISKSTSVVKARRHFVRLVLTYVDIVSYVSRGKATDESLPISNNHSNVA